MSLYILQSLYVSTCVWGICTCPCSWRLEISTEYLPPPLSTLTFAPGFHTKLTHWLTRLCGWQAPGTLLSLLPSTGVGCRCGNSTLRAPCLHSKPFSKWASPQAHAFPAFLMQPLSIPSRMDLALLFLSFSNTSQSYLTPASRTFLETGLLD